MSTVIDECPAIGPYKMIDVTNAKATVEHIIRQLGLKSQRELAARFDMSVSDVENAVKGKSAPKLELIYEKARAELGMPPNWPDKGLVMLEKVKAMTSIRVVGSAMAGEGADFQAEELDYEVPAHLTTGIEFGYIVQGTSLMPRVEPMDLLIAKPMREPAYNRIMIVRRPDGSVSAKVIGWKDSKTVLISTDGRGDEPAEVEYMGVVTAIYRPSNGFNMPKSTGMRYDDLPDFQKKT